MSTKKYLSQDSFDYFLLLLDKIFDGKVDVIDGKALSANDFTNTLKQKLEGIETGAQKNVVLSVNGETGAVQIDVPAEVLKYTAQTLTDAQKMQARENIGAGTSNFSGAYSALTGKPTKLPADGGNAATVGGHTVAVNVPADAKFTDTIYNDSEVKASIQDLDDTKAEKTEIPTVPKNVGAFTNDKGYQTSSQVTSIAKAEAEKLQRRKYKVVTTLPATGDEQYIYLVANGSTGNNKYDEYTWIADLNMFEKGGPRDIPLEDYMLKTDIVPMTNADIDEAMQILK